jgi:hypothetical protein
MRLKPIENHDERHKTCFFCNNKFDKNLKYCLKRNIYVIHSKAHHKFCCDRCYTLLTKYIKKYKKIDFSIYKGEK